MSFEFDTDTAVEHLGEGHFRGLISPGWNIAENPNGGYLLSIVTSAISQLISQPDPLSFTCHYLRPGIAGEPCELDVQVVREGRTLTTVRATMTQQGKERLVVMASYGDLGTVAGVDAAITIDKPDDMPAPGDCVPRTGDLQGIDIKLTERLDVMLHPALAAPGGADKAEISGWIRFKDGREADTRSLLLFCDTFPPSPFGKLGVVGWVPTIELTVHIRRKPANGWILGRFRTDDLQDGRMIESGCLWDSTGNLVAQCRQIGLVLSRD